MKPGELIILRNHAREQKKQIEDLRRVGATYMIQANELKGWIIAVLKKVGPVEITQAELDAIGVDEKGTPSPKDLVFVVVPDQDRPGVYVLSVADLERPATPSEGGGTADA